MRQQPPISFRPGQQQPQQNTQFNRNQFQNQQQNQFQQNTNFMQFNNQGYNNQGNLAGGPVPQRQQQTNQKSTFHDPRAGSNMNAKYIAHLKTLQDFINKNDVKDFPGAKLVNNTESQLHNFDLSLDLSQTIKSDGADVPVKLRIGPKFPNEKPKLFAAVTMKHSAIDSSTLEIDYSKYYQWNKNSTIKGILTQSIQYFQQNPVSNNAIEKKMRDLIKGIDVTDIQKAKQANIKEFYQQITPNEQNDFKDNNKRLEILKKMPEFKAVTDKHEKLVRIADQLKEKVTENYQRYESRTFEFLSELDQFEELKQQVFAKYSASVLLQERFTKGQLLPVIEDQIRQINIENAPAKFQENLGSCKNDADAWNCMQQFLKERKDTHATYIRCQKLKENMT